MKTIIAILLAAVSFLSAGAYKYTYTFRNTPVAEALVNLCKENPEVQISFIYKELDKYRTSARIQTDDTYEALRRIAGLNPISVVQRGNEFYVEALQHGKYVFTGRVTDVDNDPLAAATVMLLAPKDSVVITYGVTDSEGRFTIPCDRRDVIGKVSCLGYKTAIKPFTSFATGTIVMQRQTFALSEIKVEADNAHIYSDKSVYVPTARQKDSSMSGMDLLNRMAIPQLAIGNKIQTATNQPVSVYIDYMPATNNDLTGMLTSDVKRVEYYDYPADPRFQGNAHVINFIMQRYEYGGYLKGIYYDNFVISRQLNAYAKFQYKNTTFDLAGGPFMYNSSKTYEESDETFRLPQDDGTVKVFERTSEVDKAKERQNLYWASLKALYRTDNISMSNMISTQFDRTPEKSQSGTMTYTPADYATSEYYTDQSKRINSASYTGYWNFRLPHDNTITFNPYYVYSHTNQTSIYEEKGFETIRNGARDDSHQASGQLAFTHKFGTAGTLKTVCQANFLQNRTHYSGTSTLSDLARTYRLGPGVSYSYSGQKFYGNAGFGLHWDKSTYGDIVEKSVAPWANLSLQYAFSSKNSVSASVDFKKSTPSSGYRSAALVQANPLMSYTGNPALVPYNSIDVEAQYTFIPSNKYNFAVFGWAWIVDNRYVYDYEASSTGILRTIKQPLGAYAQGHYGVQASTRQFDNNLNVGVALYARSAHNGAPYNWTRTNLVASLSVWYYLNKFYFGANLATSQGYPDGCMVGTWMKESPSYTFQAGWSNKHWHFRFFTRNFLKYNTSYATGVMHSTWYDSTVHKYNGSNAGFFQIMATYTFSFGKKIKEGQEAYQGSGASTGILK